ncbi:MAG: hypothetical protein ACPG7F_03865 [Aggregatilineales bacterium]
MQKLKFIVLTIIIFVMTVLPAFAQEVAEASEAPQGIDLLLLLVGAGGVLIVGGGMAARDAAGNNNDDS